MLVKFSIDSIDAGAFYIGKEVSIYVTSAREERAGINKSDRVAIECDITEVEFVQHAYSSRVKRIMGVE